MGDDKESAGAMEVEEKEMKVTTTDSSPDVVVEGSASDSDSDGEISDKAVDDQEEINSLLKNNLLK